MEGSGFRAQKKIIDVDRGIFIIRYSAAQDESYPRKSESRLRLKTTKIKILSRSYIRTRKNPFFGSPVPGAGCPRSEPDLLTVEVIPTSQKGSIAATVRVEQLTQGEPALEITDADNWNNGWETSTSQPRAAGAFRVLGHVAGRGDLYVNANEWIGGPAAPMRIEGLAIEWPQKPEGLAVRYSVKMPKGPPSSGPLGTFAGTRGKALPLIGVLLELVGEEASNFELVADAVFLGSPEKRSTGQKVVLAGPTGREPLVGIRIGIEPVARTDVRKLTVEGRPPKKQQSSRVKVFRSTDPGKA